MSRRPLLLFDVDGTLTKSRNKITQSMKVFMLNVSDRVSVALVGGSDIHKITEQLGEECN
jgi:phosphomannomutase